MRVLLDILVRILPLNLMVVMSHLLIISFVLHVHEPFSWPILPYQSSFLGLFSFSVPIVSLVVISSIAPVSFRVFPLIVLGLLIHDVALLFVLREKVLTVVRFYDLFGLYWV